MSNIGTNFKIKKSVQKLIFLFIIGIFNAQFSVLEAEELHANPTAVVFNAIEGQQVNITRSIFIFSSLGTSLNWTVSEDASWLTTNITDGITDGILKIGVNTDGMPSGIYSGKVTIMSAESTADPVIVEVTLVINPDVSISVTTWRDGYSSAMSVSVDDSQASGFTDLYANGFTGTYVLEGQTPHSYYTDYYNAGMELGCHSVHHICSSLSDDVLRIEEIEPNIQALCTLTPEPCNDVISFVWPCGYTNYREQKVTSDYFLSARGYNINQLEDANPENFMNLKGFNSHEHYPYPPSDLKTVVDAAISQKKWFNLVLHDYSNDDGAINYSKGKDIWVTAIGNVIKYILQRDRFILSDYTESTDRISFNVSRLRIPSSPLKNFELAFHPADIITIQIDIDDDRTLENLTINGIVSSYRILDLNGNKVLYVNINPDPSVNKLIEIKYLPVDMNLSISGVTASNKIYDGTSTAIINIADATLSGVLEGDTVTLVSDDVSGSFIDKTAGTSKLVYFSGFALSGADASKYHLVQPTATANITKASVTVSGITANNKVYDGTTFAKLRNTNAVLSGVIGADKVNLVSTGSTGTFATRNAGNGIIVSISGYSLGGLDGANYQLTQQSSTTANITKAPLTITGATAINKVYDGTSTVVINTASAVLSGVFGSDAVTLIKTGATGTFSDKNVGTSKTVTISGFALGGSDAGNYSIVQPVGSANITTKQISITGVTAGNKVYNGSTAASINYSNALLTGVITGDAVNLSSTGVSGNFADKNAGTGKSVSISGFSISGAAALNYILIQPIAYADITRAPLTINGAGAISKTYDGTTVAALNTSNVLLSGVLGGDNVTLISGGAVGAFTDKNAGTGKPVVTTGFAMGGPDAGNYSLTQPSVSANIGQAFLSVTGITAMNKTYDGTTSAILNTSGAALSGILINDVVTFMPSGATGTFLTKDAGTGKVVTVNGAAFSGADAGNYILIQPELSASIMPRDLTITALNQVKSYGNSLSFNGTEYAVSGLIAGDLMPSVVINSTGSEASAEAGVYPVVIQVAPDANYNVIKVNGLLTVNKLIITAKAEDKSRSYGSDNPLLTITYSGFKNGEDATVLDSEPAASTFVDNSSNVGSYAIILSGGTDNNYDFNLTNGNLNIRKAPLTITADNITRPYGQVNPQITLSYAGFLNGDNQSVLDNLPVSSTDAEINSDAGTYDITLMGASDLNYSFVYKTGKFIITKADQSITFEPLPFHLKAKQETSLTASASSDLRVDFELSDPDIAELEGDKLKTIKSGNLVIRMTQQGDHNWNPAPEVTQSIIIDPSSEGISSLITPNNDGMNDYWNISDIDEYGEIQVSIYDRFGKLVYKSDAYNNDWYGTCNGYPLPAASYYYLIKSSVKGSIKGVINIAR